MNKSKQFNYCNVEGSTDVGCKRKANEDWYGYFECKNGLVSVVCDGMGGHVGGAIASHLAVDTIQEFLKQNYFDNPREAIIEACNTANAALLQRAQEQPELTGMGATCIMLIVRDGKVYIGSIGDSRIYLIRSKTITQLTKDQSYVQMLVDAHEISKEQAEHHPRKNEILNALGLPSMQPATVLPDPISPEAGDVFLLCSDGLSGMVSDREILKIASNQAGMTQRERVNALIQAARKNGGHDNITSLLVEFSITPPGAEVPVSAKHNFIRYGLIALAAILMIGLGGYFLWAYLNPKQIKEDEHAATMDEEKDKNVIHCNDTILYNKNKICIEIEEHKGLGAYIYVINKKKEKDTITIKEPIDIKSVVVEPEANLEVASGSPERCIVKFNDKEFDSENVSLTLKVGDSTFVYKFPVENPKNLGTSGNGSPDDVSLNRNAVAKGDTQLEVVEDHTNSQTKEVPESKEESLEVTFKVDKEGETELWLISAKETPTTTKAYTEYAIKPGQKFNEWYSYSCTDGQSCKITVHNENVPEMGNIIYIPLNNAGGKVFKIRVVHK